MEKDLVGTSRESQGRCAHEPSQWVGPVWYGCRVLCVLWVIWACCMGLSDWQMALICRQSPLNQEWEERQDGLPLDELQEHRPANLHLPAPVSGQPLCQPNRGRETWGMTNAAPPKSQAHHSPSKRALQVVVAFFLDKLKHTKCVRLISTYMEPVVTFI